MNPDIRCKAAWLFAGVLALATAPGRLAAQVEEVEDPDLPVVAMTRADPDLGLVVVYNPALCARLGAACGFLRMHAQGHVFYGHPPVLPADYSDREETLADCWAAREGDPMQILATHQWLSSGSGHAQLGVHGDTLQRAKNIRNCAIQGGNWLGN